MLAHYRTWIHPFVTRGLEHRIGLYNAYLEQRAFHSGDYVLPNAQREDIEQRPQNHINSYTARFSNREHQNRR